MPENRTEAIAREFQKSGFACDFADGSKKEASCALDIDPATYRASDFRVYYKPLKNSRKVFLDDPSGRKGAFEVPKKGTLEFQNPTFAYIGREEGEDQIRWKKRTGAELRAEIKSGKFVSETSVTFRVYIPDPDHPEQKIRAANLF